MTQPIPLPAIALAAGLLVGPALAQDTCALPYATFETSVPHTDLEACPGSAEAPDGTFCRAVLATELVTLYVFEEAGEQCLVSSRIYDEDQFSLELR